MVNTIPVTWTIAEFKLHLEIIIHRTGPGSFISPIDAIKCLRNALVLRRSIPATTDSDVGKEESIEEDQTRKVTQYAKSNLNFSKSRCSRCRRCSKVAVPRCVVPLLELR